MYKLHICVYTCTRGQTDAHTHHSLCKVLHIVYQVLNFKMQKILVKIFYILFYRKCQTPPHGFGCGCGYLQITHHHWPGSPGMQGWTMQGGQEVLSCTRKPSSGSHSHPQNASSKAPASCQVEPDTDFPESSIWFWGKVWMNQADENKSAERYREVVNPSHASLAGWLLAWVIWGPTESRSKMEDVLLLNNLISCQYSATGEMYFQMWDVTSTPYSCFLKHIRVPHQGWPFSSEIIEQIYSRFKISDTLCGQWYSLFLATVWYSRALLNSIAWVGELRPGVRWALVQGHADSWCSIIPRCLLIIEATFDSLWRP